MLLFSLSEVGGGGGRKGCMELSSSLMAHKGAADKADQFSRIHGNILQKSHLPPPTCTYEPKSKVPSNRVISPRFFDKIIFSLNIL